MYLNLLLSGCVQVHSKVYNLRSLSTSFPRHVIKDFSIKPHLLKTMCVFVAKSELAFRSWFECRSEILTFPDYLAAQTVTERPLKGPGVPWQHFDGSRF